MQNEIVDQPQIEVDNCNDMSKSGYYSNVIIMLQFMQISLERVFIFFPLIQLCRDIPYSNVFLILNVPKKILQIDEFLSPLPFKTIPE